MDPEIREVKSEKIAEEHFEEGEEDLENAVFMDGDEEEFYDDPEMASQDIPNQEKFGMRTLVDEFGEYEVNVSVRDEHTQTTVRLVTELFEKGEIPMNLLSSDSFLQMMHHLNPAAYVPNEGDVIAQSAAPRDFPSPTECIFCGQEGEEENTSTLSPQEAALVLTTTILVMQRDPNEAAKRILSASLRCCKNHIDDTCERIANELELNAELDFEATSLEKIIEWSQVYKGIMLRRENLENPRFGAANMRDIVSNFMSRFWAEFEDPEQMEFEGEEEEQGETSSAWRKDRFDEFEEHDLRSDGEEYEGEYYEGKPTSPIYALMGGDEEEEVFDAEDFLKMEQSSEANEEEEEEEDEEAY